MHCYSMQGEQPINQVSGPQVKFHCKLDLHQSPGTGLGMNVPNKWSAVSLPIASSECLELVKCGCKSEKQRGARCSCKKGNCGCTSATVSVKIVVFIYLLIYIFIIFFINYIQMFSCVIKKMLLLTKYNGINPFAYQNVMQNICSVNLIPKMLMNLAEYTPRCLVLLSVYIPFYLSAL